LRSDDVVAVPALELQQHYFKRLAIAGFADYLMAAPSPGGLGVEHGVWGVGVQVLYHDEYSDLGSLTFAYGQGGLLRLSLRLGDASMKNERSSWKY
jgi:hypothetical protein